ncbi:hypothetical protein ACFLTO_02725 [Chloroflexota bacterium]
MDKDVELTELTGTVNELLSFATNNKQTSGCLCFYRNTCLV